MFEETLDFDTFVFMKCYLKKYANAQSKLVFILQPAFSFSHFATSSSNSASAASRTEHSVPDYESNVDQDISKLAARTHAEQTSAQSGRRRMQSQQDGEDLKNFGSSATSIDIAAQGRNGFRTVGLDLGALVAHNNGGMRSQDSSDTNAENVRSAGYNARDYHSNDYSNKYHKQSETTGSNSEEDYENVDGDYDESEDGKEQSGKGGSWSRTSSFSNSHKQPVNAQHASVDQMFKHYPKSKRDTSEVIQLPICKSTECEYVRCVVGPLDKNSGALIALRTRLIASTLNKVKCNF